MAGSADTAVRRGLGRYTVRPAEEGWVGATLLQVPISKGADAVGPCRTRQRPGRSQEKGRGTRPGCARHSHDAAFVVQAPTPVHKTTVVIHMGTQPKRLHKIEGKPCTVGKRRAP
ncbi:hypothetical protein V6N13_037340 [Hibiscus sabdariffa]